MKFINLSPAYLESDVAIPAAKFCRGKYGANGFRTEEGIDNSIPWRPTFQLKRSQFEILAVEVSERVFPAVLKEVSYDLLSKLSDRPVVVCVACPLSVYQSDSRHADASQLKERGFGLYTVDDVGNVIEQIPGIPLIHNIPAHEVAKDVKPIPSAVRTKLLRAYDVYRTNSYQGLQDAAQVIEALIFGWAAQTKKKGWIQKVKQDAAFVIDDLYASTEQRLVHQRAAIGSARGFIKYYRNLSSHPPKNQTAAAELIRKCKKGFESSVETAKLLCDGIKASGCKTKMHIP